MSTMTEIVYSTSTEPYHWDHQGGDKRQDDCYTLMTPKANTEQRITELEQEGMTIVSVADIEQPGMKLAA